MIASLSKAMNASTLEQYHSKDNYYSQGEGLQNSQWQGSFAAHQGLEGSIHKGLEGSIHKADWQQACNGNDPQGNELRRKQNNSRAGWDITLSAPKSASLKALIDQDDRVLEAHRKAVHFTVQYIEQNCIYAQIKDQGQLKREQTQKGQFALFEHDDNRKQEPQLHTHVVILNQTLCQDGKTRTLDSRELFVQKKTIGAYYDHTFAHHLKEQGFEIEWTSAHTFEIKGYQKDQLEAFSGRRQQIREHLAAQNIKLEHATAQQKEIACLESRPIKLNKNEPIDREIQQTRWQEESDRLGIIHPQPIQTLNKLYELNPHPGSLNETINASIENATAYKVALTRQELLRVALAHTQEHYSPSEIEPALSNHPALIQTLDGRLTTQQTLEREQFILKTANGTQNTQPPLSSQERIAQVAQTTQLNEGQTQALYHIATSPDLIALVQGNAGAGKTYMLNAFRECLTPEARTQLRGLAPSAAAAETLETETSIPSITLDRYLLTPNDQTPKNQTLLIDEAGMISSQQMERLIRKAQATQSRIILVGDTQQLNSIEAGAPFRLLQERSNLKTATLSENLRQKTPHLFIAANLAAEQQTNEALETLDRHNSIQEISDLNQRNQSVAEQYLAREPREQARTLILCDTNQDRQAITDQIRANYISNSTLGETSRTLAILYPKKLDPQALTQAYSYQKGDVIRFTRRNTPFPDAYYRVAEVKDQSLILKDRTGQFKEILLSEYKEREVYQCQSLEIRAGDRLRFTRNQRFRNQINGQPYTIEALNPDNTIEIRTKGQRYTVTANQLLHSDYAYCRTVYSAQGWTSAEAIWAPQQTPVREQTYVALTRAKESLQILTLNRAALGLSAQTSQRQENALDLIESIIPSTQALKPEPEPVQAPETQQLSLFPGMTDDLERKVKPQPEKPARQYPEPAQSDRQTDQSAEQAEPTRATDGVSAPSDIAPVRGRFTELAERTRELSEQLERTRRTPERQRSATRTDDGIDADPAADDRELHHEPEPTHPTQPEPRNPTAAANPGNPVAEATTAEIDRADEPRLEPDQGIHTQAGEPLEPDSGHAQPSRDQHEDILNHPNDGDRLDESIGDGISRTIPELAVQPNVRADQWKGKRSSDSNEQVSEAPEVEDPTVQQLQRQMAISQTWSDDRLLSIAAEVQDYFSQAPLKPDMDSAERLYGELERLKEQDRQLRDMVNQQRQALETLGPARSWKYLFGSDPQKVKAAEQRLEQTTRQRAILGQRIQTTQETFRTWQQEARTYRGWCDSEKGEQMHQYRDILRLEPVQERITQIHQAQEQIRQAQERQRQKEKGLEALQGWKQMAIKLGRPQAYVQRIQEITEDYGKGKPLNENQRERLSQDFADYREQLRQVQAQKQRYRGFSL
jgi:conjugative relaxase-like TrwC/TraI family protein